MILKLSQYLGLNMSLRDELYTRFSDSTLATRLDRAWGVYTDPKASMREKSVAQRFLLYVLNIKPWGCINEQLHLKMEKRQRYKAVNPEYIPGLSPKKLHLVPENMQVQQTTISGTSSEPAIQTLLNNHNMLDVNADDKVGDTVAPVTPMFNQEKRDKYRVILSRGRFQSEGASFSTAKYYAHMKAGYGAFTLNAEGELSVFTHYGQKGDPFHSSMNAGSPVMAAGELKIDNGKLIAINTYSGHYRPHLLQLYHVLEYFADSGIDISSAKIYLQHSCEDLMPCDPVNIKLIDSTDDKYYEIPASRFFYSIQERLCKAVNTINDDLVSYQNQKRNLIFKLKDHFFRSTLTEDRMALAAEVQTVLAALKGQITADEPMNFEKIDELVVNLRLIQAKNKLLSLGNGKEVDSGRLNTCIEKAIVEAEEAKNLRRELPFDLEKLQPLF